MKPRFLVWLFVLLGTWGAWPQTGVARQPEPDEVHEMRVKGVTMDPYGQTPIVILEETKGHRAFPIWIGLSEAQAIARALEGIATPRPMTHALLQNILRTLRVDVSRIVINDLRNNTFYATIWLRQGTETLTIDARPSDAIALALSVKAPIFVAPSVLQSVRTVPLGTRSPSGTTAQKFGMHLQSLDANLAQAFQVPRAEGVLIAFVEAGSPAERHGFRRGDVITDVNGNRIKDLQDFLNVFDAASGNQEMVLHVWRDRHPHTIRLSRAAQD